MYWPKFSLDKLTRLSKTKRTKSGASCAYVQWTKYVGLKMYSTKHERDTCYRLQRRAENADLGPRTGKKFEFEVFECVSDDSWSSAPVPRFVKVYCYWTEHLNQPRGVSYKREQELEDALLKIGIDHHDMARRNLGLRGKKLVCIDFDTCSCYG